MVPSTMLAELLRSGGGSWLYALVIAVALGLGLGWARSWRGSAGPARLPRCSRRFRRWRWSRQGPGAASR